MKRYFLTALFSLSLVLTLSAVGCGDSGNTVIEQPAEPMSEQFQAEENAAVNQSPDN